MGEKGVKVEREESEMGGGGGESDHTICSQSYKFPIKETFNSFN